MTIYLTTKLAGLPGDQQMAAQKMVLWTYLCDPSSVSLCSGFSVSSHEKHYLSKHWAHTPMIKKNWFSETFPYNLTCNCTHAKGIYHYAMLYNKHWVHLEKIHVDQLKHEFRERAVEAVRYQDWQKAYSCHNADTWGENLSCNSTRWNTILDAK